MVQWAADEPGALPARIVDPGAGSGRFIAAAARAFPNAQLVAIEIDPLAAMLLRVNAIIAGFAERLTIHVADYRTIELPTISGRTLFIGNPPYVRHHQISERAKAWFSQTANRLGLKASKLAGLHIHFFIRTRELARSGDFGAFITSSEWMDVNYGSVLRQLLADGLGGSALHVLDPKAQPFGDVMVTGAITCFRVGNRPRQFAIRSVNTLSELTPLVDGKALDWSIVENTSRWSTLLSPKIDRSTDMMQLGELFRVHRGQVTGMNDVWIKNPDTTKIPDKFLFPSITRAHEIFNTSEFLESADHLRQVIDLPIDLQQVKGQERRQVEDFLEWARSQGAHQSYIAKKRRAWWSVGLREPPPILCTYMARRPPVFIRNKAGARYINIAHGLYPRRPLPDAVLTATIRYLNNTVSLSGGRTYAGGLVKFEPKEIERLLIPVQLLDHERSVGA